MKKSIILVPLTIILLASCTRVPPPEPYGALPSDRQLAWHEMEYYAFIHFGPNTFTDREWGQGDETESIFNPEQLDCRQWARIIKQAGMKGIIITAKHHDGFCLWPSEYTEHSVKNSPWRNGKGDLLRELRSACDEYGLKLGIYLSPWDRNHPLYGSEEYIQYYRNQLTELLTGYGDIFEVWFDGANGGSGWYGGANETRTIDNSTYYDWPGTIGIVRSLQPGAVIFSDAGPDIRWIGNEQGYSDATNWCTMNNKDLFPGIGGINNRLRTGDKDGKEWVPAEVNTSIRPGWFYHRSQDSLVKTIGDLTDIWYHSVGMNGNLLLNLPVDKRGLIHENDSATLMDLRRWLDDAFSHNLMDINNIRIYASNTRGNSHNFGPANVADESDENYWATDDTVRTATISIEFPHPLSVNTVVLREYIKLGQRVESFSIEAETDGVRKKLAAGSTIGNRRIVPFDRVTTERLLINISALAPIVIREIQLFDTGYEK